MTLSAKRNTKAFTLLELLMVILVVAVLAALAIPQMQSFALRARGVEAMTNLRAVADALDRYYVLQGRYPQTSGIGAEAAWNNLTSVLDVKVPYKTKYFQYGCGFTGLTQYDLQAQDRQYYAPDGGDWASLPDGPVCYNIYNYPADPTRRLYIYQIKVQTTADTIDHWPGSE